MVIESIDEFNEFIALHKNSDIIIIPIFSDVDKHAANNELSFLYVKIISDNKYYVLPFLHNECINLPYSEVMSGLVEHSAKKYILDKKMFLHECNNLKNLIDINTLQYLKTNTVIHESSILKIPNSQHSIEGRFNNIKNVRNSIPILLYIEVLTDYANELEKIIKDSQESELDESFDFLNSTSINCLYNVEKEGLYVNTDLALKFFPNSKRHITPESILHTQYNLYTATGRPSNRFGNINFAALNNDNGERECFVSRYGDDGKLVLFDYDAYHFMLIANKIGYTFPGNQHVHEYLGKMYYGKDDLTEEEYKSSKEISFQLLYGGFDKTVADAIPFFEKMREFIDSMWEEASKNGYYNTIISKKKIILNNFSSLNKNKLFNYILQNYETEQNILTMTEIQRFLEDKKSKLILYLYDGFLFDIHNSDSGIEFELNKILQKNGKFPTKMYSGKDLHNLVKIE